MTSLKSKLQLTLLNRKKGRNLIEKGFTLVELMIVIVIVGILSSVALPSFLSQTSKAKATECTSKLGAMLSQVGSEALLSVADGDALAAQLKTDSDSTECTFTVSAINATTGVFDVEVAGAGELAGEYEANGCVNYKTAARDIKSATGGDTAAAAVCA